MTPGRAGRRDRPVSGLPQGPTDVAPTHRCLSRRVPPGQARQRHAHRSPVKTHSAGPRPGRPLHRPGLGQPAPAPARRGDALGPGPGQVQHRIRHRRRHRETAGRVAGQGTAPGLAGHRFSCRRGRRERLTGGPGRTGRSARNEPALAHDLPVVERDRSPHRHRRDNSKSGSNQHSHQLHQKDRPGIHQRPQLQNAYPIAQSRQNSGMNIPHGRTFTTNREEPFRGSADAGDFAWLASIYGLSRGSSSQPLRGAFRSRLDCPGLPRL